MVAFVICAHQTLKRQGTSPCLDHSSWRGQRTLSFQTRQICGRCFIYPAFQSQPPNRPANSTPRAMFSGGGILGVGPSEVVIIIAVGWLLLGPEKLFSLAKDSGRLLGDLRRTADEAKETFSDAMDLDLIAAEFEEGKQSVQKNGPPNPLNNVEEEDGEPGALPSDRTDAKADNPGQDTEDIDTEPVANAAFLEQLQRAADPNQIAPSELPDIDSESDEELEVERLEREYLEARARLENRRKERLGDNASESEAIVEER